MPGELLGVAPRVRGRRRHRPRPRSTSRPTRARGCSRSFVWADQHWRLERLDAAIEVVRARSAGARARRLRRAAARAAGRATSRRPHRRLRDGGARLPDPRGRTRRVYDALADAAGRRAARVRRRSPDRGTSVQRSAGRRRPRSSPEWTSTAPGWSGSMTITSRDNEKLKLVRKLHARRWRDKLGLFVCEGEDLVEAALGAGLEPVELLVDGEDRLRALSGRSRRPGPLAEVSTLAHPPRVLARLPARRPAALDRRAAAVGARALARRRPRATSARSCARRRVRPGFVALSAGCADPTGPKALRAAAGATFRVPVVRSTRRRGGGSRSSPGAGCRSPSSTRRRRRPSCSARSARACRTTCWRAATPSRRSRRAAPPSRSTSRWRGRSRSTRPRGASRPDRVPGPDPRAWLVGTRRPARLLPRNAARGFKNWPLWTGSECLTPGVATSDGGRSRPCPRRRRYGRRSNQP